MPDGNEAQQVLEFALLHKIMLGSVAGAIVAFGFLAGRYVFDKQLSILKQENELLEERVKKAVAELDETRKASLGTSDPLTNFQIKERKEAADRGASFRFFMSVAALITLLVSSGCLYLLNQFSIRENQHYLQQMVREDEVEADVRKIEVLARQKNAIGPSTTPKHADQSVNLEDKPKK